MENEIIREAVKTIITANKDLVETYHKGSSTTKGVVFRSLLDKARVKAYELSGGNQLQVSTILAELRYQITLNEPF